MTSTERSGTTPIGPVAAAAAAAAIGTGLANGAIAVAAVSAGVPVIGPLNLPAVVLVSIVAAVVGAVGWEAVRRRSAAPRSVLRRLVVGVLVLSFVPDIALLAVTGTSTGAAPVGALALMHLTTMGIAVAVYTRLLPVRSAVRAGR